MVIRARVKDRFVIGVELLTGLVAGAAALSAMVSFLMAVLMSQSLSTRSGSQALFVVTSIVRELPPDPGFNDLRIASQGLVLGETIDALIIADNQFNPVQSLEPLDQNLIPLDCEKWLFVPIPGGPLLAGVLPSGVLSSVFNTVLMFGLGLMAAGMTVVAILTPRYLKKRVLAPLKAILGEADRLEKGAGRTPDTARDSFHRLIVLLSERDRELELLRKHAEERADVAEWRAGTVLSSIGSSVVAIDPERQLVFFNTPAESLYDLSDDDIGSKCRLNRTEAGRKLSDILEEFQGGTLHRDMEVTGRTGKMILSVSISSSETGETVVLATDVTKVMELERRIIEETAMADLGAVSAGISHEVGNALCALSGFIELLGRGHSDDRTRGILSEARLEIESAQQIIDSFKSLVGAGSPVSSIIPAEHLLLLATEICEEMGEKCSTTGSELAGSVIVDPVLLRRCIRNLLLNSLEAEGSESVEISITCSAAELVITVRDDGSGFECSTEEIFRPLFSTKKSGGNMGIGLTVTRRIIAAFSGTVSATDREDVKGAVVTIRLPRVKETP